jgi:hypothetical protein
MVPGAGVFGISGVESGNEALLAARLVSVELHAMVAEPPTGGFSGDMVPVVLPKIGEGIVPRAVAGVIASGDIVIVDAIVAAVVPCTGTDAGLIAGDGTGIMAGGICADAADDGDGTAEFGYKVMNDATGCVENVVNCSGAQITKVPGVAGSEAIGTGASVVTGVPNRVVDEYGLGPSSGEITIAPGVVARPMDVVPRVETCARQAVQPASRVTIVSSKRRIGIIPSAIVSLSDSCALDAPRPCYRPSGRPSD